MVFELVRQDREIWPFGKGSMGRGNKPMDLGTEMVGCVERSRSRVFWLERKEGRDQVGGHGLSPEGSVGPWKSLKKGNGEPDLHCECG